MSPLTGWSTFYEIIGSSAGALTGLQFVVMTLISQTQRRGGNMREIRAFGTPTVVHFFVALLIAAMMSAPWETIRDLSICLGTCGLAGLAFAVGVVWHARRTSYKPDAEDWTWYVAVPIAIYAAVVVASVLLVIRPYIGFFAVAVSSILFLLTGVRNAWDTLTYIATRPAPDDVPPPA